MAEIPDNMNFGEAEEWIDQRMDHIFQLIADKRPFKEEVMKAYTAFKQEILNNVSRLIWAGIDKHMIKQVLEDIEVEMDAYWAELHPPAAPAVDSSQAAGSSSGAGTDSPSQSQAQPSASSASGAGTVSPTRERSRSPTPQPESPPSEKQDMDEYRMKQWFQIQINNIEQLIAMRRPMKVIQEQLDMFRKLAMIKYDTDFTALGKSRQERVEILKDLEKKVEAYYNELNPPVPVTRSPSRSSPKTSPLSTSRPQSPSGVSSTGARPKVRPVQPESEVPSTSRQQTPPRVSTIDMSSSTGARPKVRQPVQSEQTVRPLPPVSTASVRTSPTRSPPRGRGEPESIVLAQIILSWPPIIELKILIEHIRGYALLSDEEFQDLSRRELSHAQTLLIEAEDLPELLADAEQDLTELEESLNKHNEWRRKGGSGEDIESRYEISDMRHTLEELRSMTPLVDRLRTKLEYSQTLSKADEGEDLPRFRKMAEENESLEEPFKKRVDPRHSGKFQRDWVKWPHRNFYLGTQRLVSVKDPWKKDSTEAYTRTPDWLEAEIDPLLDRLRQRLERAIERANRGFRHYIDTYPIPDKPITSIEDVPEPFQSEWNDWFAEANDAAADLEAHIMFVKKNRNAPTVFPQYTKRQHEPIADPTINQAFSRYNRMLARLYQPNFPMPPSRLGVEAKKRFRHYVDKWRKRERELNFPVGGLKSEEERNDARREYLKTIHEPNCLCFDCRTLGVNQTAIDAGPPGEGEPEPDDFPPLEPWTQERVTEYVAGSYHGVQPENWYRVIGYVTDSEPEDDEWRPPADIKRIPTHRPERENDQGEFAEDEEEPNLYSGANMVRDKRRRQRIEAQHGWQFPEDVGYLAPSRVKWDERRFDENYHDNFDNNQEGNESDYEDDDIDFGPDGWDEDLYGPPPTLDELHSLPDYPNISWDEIRNQLGIVAQYDEEDEEDDEDEEDEDDEEDEEDEDDQAPTGTALRQSDESGDEARGEELD